MELYEYDDSSQHLYDVPTCGSGDTSGDCSSREAAVEKQQGDSGQQYANLPATQNTTTGSKDLEPAEDEAGEEAGDEGGGEAGAETMKNNSSCCSRKKLTIVVILLTLLVLAISAGLILVFMEMKDMQRNILTLEMKQNNADLHGAQGLNGIPGSKGEPGAIGQTGTKGARGERGTTGVTGPLGSPGLQGEPGLSGSKGEKGSPGAKGASGHRGLPGPGVVQPVPVTCPGGYTRNPISNTCIRLVRIGKTWHDAKRYCEWVGEYLATFETLESASWLKSRQRSGSSWRHDAVYIGGSRTGYNWYWRGHMTGLVKYSFWGLGEPSHGEESCMTASCVSFDCNWNDVNCGHQFYFFCEKVM